MRDDIHNKAPISAALRGVLKHALRAADQQRPNLLEALAAKALLREIVAQMTRPVVDALRLEAASPLLFPSVETVDHSSSRLQSDVIAHLSQNPQSTVAEGLRQAAINHIVSLCNESEAAMIATGRDRRDIRIGVAAFRQALMSAIPTVVSVCLDTASPVAIPDHRVTLSEALPLGQKATKRG